VRIVVLFTRSRTCVFLAVNALVLASTIEGSDRTPLLGRLDIKAAIAWGESGGAAAYSLRAKHDRTVEVGLVYTPFVRVALAAAAARAAGSALSLDAVPATLTQAIVYVVIWPMTIPRVESLRPLDDVSTQIEIGEFPGAQGSVQPMFVRRDARFIRTLIRCLSNGWWKSSPRSRQLHSVLDAMCSATGLPGDLPNSDAETG
jgi:hypothetical protein